MSLLRAPILNDIAFITAVTEAEYNAEIDSTNDTPNLALTSKLWCVFCDNFRKMDRIITASHWNNWNLAKAPVIWTWLNHYISRRYVI